ncbi:TPA: hypothetical protein N0F65_009711 [Lagenidium giganteum]|uniref:CCHC-type domain-containing protein n=1 Tax=Lagenidium giganteum TaxID=4803 RepID=A0AAV2YG81_9STRA|nr:TPA: hypothetical protein N0F65_009711 [Lagenidium giganteum]
MQRVFGIDGAHLKHRHYHGTQLCLGGRDGDFHNVVLAVAVVPRESQDNYAWFLRHIEVAGYPLQHTPLFCDRHTGLVAAGAKNMLTLTMLHDLNADAACAFRKIPPSEWCVWANANLPLYGWRTSNAVESENRRALKTNAPRLQTPYGLLHSYLKVMMQDAYNRHRAAISLEDSGHALTSAAQHRINNRKKPVGEYGVAPSSDDVYFVQNAKRVGSRERRVDLVSHTCSCNSLFQTGLPSVHIAAVLEGKKEPGRIYDFCAPIYSTQRYVKAFKNQTSELPTRAISESDESKLAVVIPRPGRPRKSRIPSRGEGDGSRSSYKCSECGEGGHNRRRCPLFS